MRNLLLIPFGLSLYSVLLFAVTGDQLWAPLDSSGTSAMRFLLLLLLHAAGFMSGLYWAVFRDTSND